MILVADAGSTSTDWALIHPDGTTETTSSEGINPVLLAEQTLIEKLHAALDSFLSGRIPREIHYYGAGCIPSTTTGMQTALHNVTGCKNISVASDLLGAARSLCLHQPGIACILGTGSNSCYYDGRQIADAVPALGFILGDEGSGASIGRRFLSDLYKRQLPHEITEAFNIRYGLSMANVIERTYRSDAPSRFLASMMPFISEHINDLYISQLVTDEFTRFLSRNVAAYPGHQQLPINFAGSVAKHFRPNLQSALDALGMRLGKISTSPIDGLIEYHT